MEYKNFIDKLYIKNVWMTKEQLTMQLFLNSVNNQSTIKDKRNSANVFKGYNRGNPIAEIARDVIGDLNETGIESFLKATFDSKPDKKSEYMQLICNRFKDDISAITPENVCKKITDFFIVEVLKTAAKECKKVIANSKTFSDEKDSNYIQGTYDKANFTDNHTEFNKINSDSSTANNITRIENKSSKTIVINIESKDRDELVNLKTLINEINSRFIDLNDKCFRLHTLSWTYSKEEQNEKEQELEVFKTEFIDGNKKLQRYYLSFSELKEKFDELIFLSSSMTFWSGSRNNEGHNLSVAQDFQVDKYRKCIAEIWEALFQ